MKKRALILAMIAFIAATTSEPSINMVRAEETQVEETQTEENAGQTSELPIKTLTPKVIDENPYMAASDSNIHHDCYNTDSTDEVLPVDIYSEINVSYEKVNPNASPAVFFDSYGHSVVPLLGGLAIRDINADETQTLGYFSPKQHDRAIALCVRRTIIGYLCLRLQMRREMYFRNLRRFWISTLKRQQRQRLEKHWIRIFLL